MRALATGHRRQENHRRAGRHFGLEPVERAHVLALDVDVDERRDVTILDELRAQSRKTSQQVLEQITNVVALGCDLALAVRVDAERRWDPDDAHLAEQNST